MRALSAFLVSAVDRDVPGLQDFRSTVWGSNFLVAEGRIFTESELGLRGSY